MPNVPFPPPKLLLGFFTMLVILATPAPISAQDPSQAALLEGNQLFRNGQIEEAVEVYRAGHTQENPHPTLLYNLGTALHHLDRLPEAILWYRRGATSDDPWLQENLWLARRSLGSQTLEPAGFMGWLSRHPRIPTLAAVSVSWLTLLFVALRGRSALWIAATGGILAGVLLAGGAAARHWGYHPAVVLEDCNTALGELPAGTEAWVRRGAEGGWIVSGAGATRCPDESLALIAPEAR